MSGRDSGAAGREGREGVSGGEGGKRAGEMVGRGRMV